MALSIGIVGLPNVGKSTLFNALAGGGAQAENYPFCTIEPNVAIVSVPDARMQKICDIVKPIAIQAATVEFVDIAGLVAGAASGEGLGNKFLANIRECSAIAHVVRCFDDDDITHVSSKVDPLADIEVIDTELMLKDMESMQRALEREKKNCKTGNKEALTRLEHLEMVNKGLEDGVPVRRQTLSGMTLEAVLPLCLLTAKPVIYIANVEDDAIPNGNDYSEKVKKWADSEGATTAVVCAQIEAEIAEMDEESRVDFLSDLGLKESGLNYVIRQAFSLLGLMCYFTAGVKEVRSWVIQDGMTAPQAAGVIHGDFERGFIRAETIHYADFIELNGETGAKEAGKMRLEGKEYIVQDGDVMHFRFNV